MPSSLSAPQHPSPAVLDPSRHSSAISPQLKPARKRAREDVGADLTPSSRRRRLASSSLRQLPNVRRSTSAPPWPGLEERARVSRGLDSDRSLIDAWLLESSYPDRHPRRPLSNRPGSCPAVVDITFAARTSASLADIRQMPSKNGATGGPSSNRLSDRQSWHIRCLISDIALLQRRHLRLCRGKDAR